MCIPTTYDEKDFKDTNGANSKDIQYKSGRKRQTDKL